MLEPATELQLSEAIRDAKAPLTIRGGGTRPIGTTGPGEVLSTAKMSGITLYEPGALTIVAQAGTPMAEIEDTLANENQCLPFEPMDHRSILGTQGTPTIGGVVAANISGPRRIQAGACRDSLIGVRFVDGQGTALKNGGRVMKNVTGYDLVKLMSGSFGTLGVLSEVAFKVLPAAASSATISLTGQTVSQAVATMSTALGSPFEISGAAHIPAASGQTLLRIEGFADSVSYRTEQITKLLEGAGDLSVERDHETTEMLWSELRDVKPLQEGSGNLWRLSVKPSDAPAVAAQLGEAQALYDWGGGLIWVKTSQTHDLRETLKEIPGHATLIKGSEFATFHPEPAPIAAISAGLREKFDPRQILNPGLMS